MSEARRRPGRPLVKARQRIDRNRAGAAEPEAPRTRDRVRRKAAARQAARPRRTPPLH